MKNGNERFAALFVADVRIAGTRDTSRTRYRGSKIFGFDAASLQPGYGHALDFVLDRVIA